MIASVGLVLALWLGTLQVARGEANQVSSQCEWRDNIVGWELVDEDPQGGTAWIRAKLGTGEISDKIEVTLAAEPRGPFALSELPDGCLSEYQSEYGALAEFANDPNTFQPLSYSDKEIPLWALHRLAKLHGSEIIVFQLSEAPHVCDGGYVVIANKNTDNITYTQLVRALLDNDRNAQLAMLVLFDKGAIPVPSPLHHALLEQRQAETGQDESWIVAPDGKYRVSFGLKDSAPDHHHPDVWEHACADSQPGASDDWPWEWNWLLQPASAEMSPTASSSSVSSTNPLQSGNKAGKGSGGAVGLAMQAIEAAFIAENLAEKHPDMPWDEIASLTIQISLQRAADNAEEFFESMGPSTARLEVLYCSTSTFARGDGSTVEKGMPCIDAIAAAQHRENVAVIHVDTNLGDDYLDAVIRLINDVNVVTWKDSELDQRQVDLSAVINEERIENDDGSVTVFLTREEQAAEVQERIERAGLIDWDAYYAALSQPVTRKQLVLLRLMLRRLIEAGLISEQQLRDALVAFVKLNEFTGVYTVGDVNPEVLSGEPLIRALRHQMNLHIRFVQRVRAKLAIDPTLKIDVSDASHHEFLRLLGNVSLAFTGVLPPPEPREVESGKSLGTASEVRVDTKNGDGSVSSAYGIDLYPTNDRGPIVIHAAADSPTSYVDDAFFTIPEQGWQKISETSTKSIYVKQSLYLGETIAPNIASESQTRDGPNSPEAYIELLRAVDEEAIKRADEYGNVTYFMHEEPVLYGLGARALKNAIRDVPEFTKMGTPRSLEELVVYGKFATSDVDIDNLRWHTQADYQPSGTFFPATSQVYGVARSIGRQNTVEEGEGETFSVVLVKVRNGLNVNAGLGSKNLFDWEYEVVIPGGIRAEDIIGGHEVDVVTGKIIRELFRDGHGAFVERKAGQTEWEYRSVEDVASTANRLRGNTKGVNAWHRLVDLWNMPTDIQPLVRWVEVMGAQLLFLRAARGRTMSFEQRVQLRQIVVELGSAMDIISHLLSYTDSKRDPTLSVEEIQAKRKKRATRTASYDDRTLYIDVESAFWLFPGEIKSIEKRESERTTPHSRVESMLVKMFVDSTVTVTEIMKEWVDPIANLPILDTSPFGSASRGETSQPE